jgi:glycosyltransferase involved in cell wall biosynthesis
MSEHEGFGVPLVEAMLMRVPILAHATTAVADTLGDAGVQFTEKSFPEIAEVGRRLAAPGPLRDAVLAGQDRRVAAFRPESVEARLRAHLQSL